MWIRTGTRGYFVAVCANGTVELHRLATDAPGDQQPDVADPAAP